MGLTTRVRIAAAVCFFCWLVAPPASSGFPVAFAAKPAAQGDGNSTVLAMPEVSDLKTSPTNLTLYGTGAAGKEGGQVFTSVQSFADGRAFYLTVSVEFRSAPACANFQHDGFTRISSVDRFADFYVLAEIDKTRPTGLPTEDVRKVLRDDADVVWYDRGLALIVPPPLPAKPLVVATPRAPPEATALGGVLGWNGKGVMIAIIDTGIDFHHPDFTEWVNGQQRSRIKYFWDTTAAQNTKSKFGSPGPCTDPTGAPVGTVYTGAELSQNLDRSTSAIPGGDRAGHGTACASIAAGNGSATKSHHQGVAPEADLIMVRIARQESLENVYLLGAICDWLDKKATEANEPLVVSCSFATQFGGHDGGAVMEQSLDARFPLNKPGRALCVAAGNEGATPFHFGFDFGAKDSILAWKVDPKISGPQAKTPTTIQIWIATDQINDLKIVAGTNTHAEVLDRFVRPLVNGKASCVELQASGPSGNVQLLTNSGRTYPADAYVIDGPSLLNPATTENSVGCPGTGKNAITVGSYNWNDQFDFAEKGMAPIEDPVTNQAVVIGARSDFSSIGYRRDEDSDDALKPGFIVKPDFLAPGQWFTAAAIRNPDLELDSSGFYRAFSGTSAATPYTAGVVALMFQANPKLTFGEIKTRLQKSLTQPPRPDKKCPNPRWGYGKLDLPAVVTAIGQPADKKPTLPSATK